MVFGERVDARRHHSLRLLFGLCCQENVPKESRGGLQHAIKTGRSWQHNSRSTCTNPFNDLKLHRRDSSRLM